MKTRCSIALTRSERLDEPPVDHKISPGYVAGALASQQYHQLRDLLRIGEAARRGLLRLLRCNGGGVPALSPGHRGRNAVVSEPERGGHWPRTHGVDADPIWPDLLR